MRSLRDRDGKTVAHSRGEAAYPIRAQHPMVRRAAGHEPEIGPARGWAGRLRGADRLAAWGRRSEGRATGFGGLQIERGGDLRRLEVEGLDRFSKGLGLVRE